MAKIIKLNFFGILSLLYLFSCKQPVSKVKDTTTIEAGTSTITGRMTSPNDTSKDSIHVNIFVSHPISGETVQYKALVDQSGKFSVDVDVETAVSLIALSTSLNPYTPLYVKLTSGGVTNLEIAYNPDFDIENINVTPANMAQNDMIQGLEAVLKCIRAFLALC